MKKKKVKEKKFVENEGPVLIDKIFLLTDDEKRGWFRFWTMESDEKWYGSWWSSIEDTKDKKKLAEMVFFDYIRTNFSGNGLKSLRLYFQDGSFHEVNYTTPL